MVPLWGYKQLDFSRAMGVACKKAFDAKGRGRSKNQVKISSIRKNHLYE